MNRSGVPGGLALAADLSLRFLLVAAAIAVIAYLVMLLRLVVLPVAIAILLATVLVPPARALRRRGVPDGLAAGAVVAAAVAVVAGLAAGLSPAVVREFRDVGPSVRGGVERVQNWLVDGPLGLSQEQVERAFDRATEQVSGAGSSLAGGAVSGAFAVAEVVAGALLTIVLAYFFVRDGERLWAWVVRLFPAHARDEVHAIGVASWRTLAGYVRGVAAVAAIDAVLIGAALVLIGVPLALPLSVLTFFGGFVPIVGAFVAGFIAVMVALFDGGFMTAVLVLAAVVAVQQIEGNLLQPLIVGRSVRLHPVAILLSVAAGGVLWGVVGAFLAVPVASVVAQAAAVLTRPAPPPELDVGVEAPGTPVA
jgi:putative heme transporter